MNFYCGVYQDCFSDLKDINVIREIHEVEKLLH